MIVAFWFIDDVNKVAEKAAKKIVAEAYPALADEVRRARVVAAGVTHAARFVARLLRGFGSGTRRR